MTALTDNDYPTDLDEDLFNEELDDLQNYEDAFEDDGWEAWCAWAGGQW